MKNEDESISEGLNQIFEIINSKGDTDELREIVNRTQNSPDENQEEK